MANRDLPTVDCGHGIESSGAGRVGPRVVGCPRGDSTKTEAQIVPGYLHPERVLGRPGACAHDENEGVLAAVTRL